MIKIVINYIIIRYFGHVISLTKKAKSVNCHWLTLDFK